jgi:hypothetical protein
MHHLSLPIGIFALTCGLLAGAATAHAAPETWVSGTGSDTGNCPSTAPCKTFAYAHTKTNPGGSINVLSSGNFGPLTITKSISIVAQGVEAVINTGAGGAAIIVQGTNIVVALRGLTIDVSGNVGISFVAGSSALHVQNCIIRRTTNGIDFLASSGTSKLDLVDTVVASATNIGINVRPTGSGGVMAALDRVRVESRAATGIFFNGTATTGSIAATVRDSVSAGNFLTGIGAQAGGGGTTFVMIDRSVAVNNGTGIFATGLGVGLRIGNSLVSGNTTGLSGSIFSYLTNKVNGNGTDGSGSTVLHK